ncbi:MAG: hypothetical protein HYZ31_12575 [Gammaproteobacteria bacterium]|nr:hypothetical protein [Gammaproteobacteria bacterium]
MKLFDFIPSLYREQLDVTLQPLKLSLQASKASADQNALKMVAALLQSVDIMERADADIQQIQALQPAAASEIADYIFNILDQLAIISAHRGLQQQMLQLHRLALPVAYWLYRHKGVITRLDVLVNALASYANELTETSRLEELSALAEKVVAMADENIRRDLDNTDPRRPWRVLNLNWGIIATRTHNVVVMQRTFDQLIKNIPLDAGNFFREGMQQMAIINYPQHVKDVMEKYYRHSVSGDKRH